MLSKIYISLLLLCFVSLNVISQSTNTKKWRKTENDSMQSALMMFDDGNYLLALPFYENLYNSHPKEEFLKYCYGKCALYRSDKHEMALTLLSEVYAKNKKADNIEYDLARAYHFNYKFDEAIALADKCIAGKRTSPEIKQSAAQLKQYCINGKELYSHPTGAKISNFGNKINSANDEYVPVVSADESIMIFTYRGPESKGGRQNDFKEPDKYGSYFEDVFQSVQIDGQWTKPVPVNNVNTNSHDGAIALSADGMYLFVYRDMGDDHGDIYMSNSLSGEWSFPQKLNGQVNSYSWEGSCSLTADGKQLYFSSERGGGFGGKDIYRATLLPDSTWGNVVNLGDSINTALDDDAPFIHPDGVTLFYSSKGKNSMGGYDIFQSKLNWKDSTFIRPVNLGYPINTTDDDIYYVLSANGERGYYASGKSGGEGLKDIYTVYPGYVGKKPSLYIVKGKITSDGSPVAATVLVEITDKNNKKFGEFVSSSSNGNYLVSLPAGGIFKLTYKYKTSPSKTLDINTMALEGFEQKIFDVSFNISDTVKPVEAVIPPPVKDTVVAVVATSKPAKEPVVKEAKAPVVKEPKTPVVHEPKEPVVKTPVAKKDNFKPNNALQQKIKDYSALYGDISAEGLIFKVQIAAYKNPKNYTYSHLRGLGAVEKLLLDDGITRITIGGEFKTLGQAYTHNKKVVYRGQKDAFVTVLYNGKRIYLEDLEKMGIFVKK
ncbi:MAG: PD40 domain-containing protein [Bacteroidetes bacterium]|nr:PD40 domain-containing protein [Bacteroidota bacterium]